MKLALLKGRNPAEAGSGFEPRNLSVTMPRVLLSDSSTALAAIPWWQASKIRCFFAYDVENP